MVYGRSYTLILILINRSLLHVAQVICNYTFIMLKCLKNTMHRISCLKFKTESTRKLSNLNFQWTKTLYQNNI